eukprot:scaffold40984_cov61-Phaeocystis_antarctica.AAC.5
MSPMCSRLQPRVLQGCSPVCSRLQQRLPQRGVRATARSSGVRVDALQHLIQCRRRLQVRQRRSAKTAPRSPRRDGGEAAAQRPRRRPAPLIVRRGGGGLAAERGGGQQLAVVLHEVGLDTGHVDSGHAPRSTRGRHRRRRRRSLRGGISVRQPGLEMAEQQLQRRPKQLGVPARVRLHRCRVPRMHCQRRLRQQ